MGKSREHLKEIEEAICLFIYYNELFLTQIRNEFSSGETVLPSREPLQGRTNEALGILFYKTCMQLKWVNRYLQGAILNYAHWWHIFILSQDTENSRKNFPAL